MLIAMDQVIHDIKNQAVTDNGKEFTLGDACVKALSLPFPDEQNLSGEEKVKRFKLALKIHDIANAELSDQDDALLKKVT